jgi:hypothetical protein
MNMLYAAIYILCVCGGAALVYWAVDKLGTPDPLANIVKVLTICVAIVLILLSLLGMGGGLPGLHSESLGFQKIG